MYMLSMIVINRPDYYDLNDCQLHEHWYNHAADGHDLAGQPVQRASHDTNDEQGVRDMVDHEVLAQDGCQLVN